LLVGNAIECIVLDLELLGQDRGDYLQLGELEEAGVMLAPFMKPGAMIEDAVPLIVQHLMERGSI
jgi:hypothetical protein